MLTEYLLVIIRYKYYFLYKEGRLIHLLVLHGYRSIVASEFVSCSTFDWFTLVLKCLNRLVLLFYHRNFFAGVMSYLSESSLYDSESLWWSVWLREWTPCNQFHSYLSIAIVPIVDNLFHNMQSFVTKHFLDPERLFRWHRDDPQKVT